MDIDDTIKCWKFSHMFLSSLGIVPLILLSFGRNGDLDCDSDGDGDFDCDSDGDGRCDYGHNHDDDLDRKLFEAVEWQEMQLRQELRRERKKSAQSNGLKKLQESEVKKIRRKAFLWKHKNIKVGYCTEDLLDKNMETVYTLLYNQAFKHINCVPDKILGPNSAKKVGSVKKIEIGGCTSFLISDQFPYDTNVTIYYREKKEIKMPFSGKSLRKREYGEVCRKLETMGFSNIKRKPKRSIVTGLTKSDGLIDKVYINGNASFTEGEVFQYDVEVIVEYHSRLLG